MLLRLRPVRRRAPLIVLAVWATLLAIGCRHRATPAAAPDDILPAGEPETYSATVVRILDDGTPHEASVSRVVRAGDLRREEWSEPGEARALIWRPDLGKLFLLSLTRKEVVEFELAPPAANASSVAARNAARPQQADANAARAAAPVMTPAEIERATGDAPEPVALETRVLADVTLDHHPCQVVEQRARFADGHAETTRTLRARDLGGLELRVEIAPEAQPGSVKVITERRAIRTEVSPDEFNVPADFKRKAKVRE